MGHTKLLLPVGDKPVIARCIETFFKAGVGEIIVVTRMDGGDIRDAIAKYPVNNVINPLPRSDMAGSVRAGLAAAKKDGGGIFVAPADYPLVTPKTIIAMDWEFQANPGIVIPRCWGFRGHPVLFPRKRLDEIFDVPILRNIIARHPEEIRYIDVCDEGTILDMDTPEDYQRILRRYYSAQKAGWRPSTCEDGVFL